MDGKDLPSSSDESDEDFVPKGEDYKSDSDSEESDCEISKDEDDDKNSKSRKRKKGNRRKGKKLKTEENDEEKEEESTEENKKIDINALWEDFKKDVNNPVAKKTGETPESNSNDTTEGKITESTENCNVKTSTADKQPRSSVNFPSRGRGRGTIGGGLSSVLNKIGKKDKMSTLQKSQLDWNNFKKSEGIEEEIKLHNRGKDGYLDKQDFLQRTDFRQFEIEKDLRSTRRKF